MEQTTKPSFPWLILILSNLTCLLVGIFLTKLVLFPGSSLKPIPTPTPTPEATTLQTFSNSDFNFSIQYPSGYIVQTQDTGNGILDVPYTILAMGKYKSYPNPSRLVTTNNILIQHIPNLNTPSKCNTTPPNSQYPLTKSMAINGQQFFYTEPYGGAAAGTHSLTINYRVFLEAGCLELNSTHVESSDWNISGDFELAEADKEAFLLESNQILSTFKLTHGSPTIQPSNTNLLNTSSWAYASTSQFSLKYPSDIYSATSTPNAIQLVSKSNPNDRPDFIIYDYDGASRRTWFNNFYSFYSNEVNFTDKQLGSVSALFASYPKSSPTHTNYVTSSGKKIVLVLPQGANTQVLETMISTLVFK